MQGWGGGGGGGSWKGDHTDDEEDRFTARITASAVDYTIDEGTGTWAFPRWKPEADPNRSMQRSIFTEFWTFQWKGKGCKLIRIDQKGAGSRYSGMKNVLQDEKYGAQGGHVGEKDMNMGEESIADEWIGDEEDLNQQL